MEHKRNDWNDDFAVEIVDLEPHEGFDELNTPMFARLRSSLKVSLKPREEHEEEEDECEFDVRFIDLPSSYGGQDILPDNLQESNTLGPTTSRFHKLRRLFSPFHLLFLLVILGFAGSTMPPVISLPVVINTQSPQLFNTDGSLHISGFNVVNQAQTTGGFGNWYRVSRSSSTVSIVGVVTGHTATTQGAATWEAAPLPQSCLNPNFMATPYTGDQLALWLIDYKAPYIAIHLPRMTSTTLNSWHGWRILIGGTIGKQFIGPLTLTLDSQSGPAPTFTPTFSPSPVYSMGFDPGNYPSRIMQKALHNRLLWTIPIYLPGAGCYTIKADWPGGSHTISLVAGQ